ncbi:MAG: hypothetical protein EOO05_10555 [Chitinophagaceae bacterium]|nr:MAG: hypothetical protein EOO05_10555 [Chitinophagaceae bacterium]
MRLLLLVLAAIGSQMAISQPQQKISRLLPDHVNLQFAGAIGFVSAGVGYETKNHRLQGDFFYGYVPESVGGVEIHSVTAKMTWAAITRQVRPDLRVDWLTTGVFLNYVFGKQYFLFDPEEYPFSYYGFPTAANVGISLGGQAFYHKLGVYYELGTTDRYVMSFIQNSGSLSFADLFNLGLGVKYSLLGHHWQRHKKKLPEAR